MLLRTTFLFTVCLLLLLAPSTANAQPLSKSHTAKPNIILINLDDANMSIMSEENLVHYPTLQTLASQSVRFTNCHATTPRCGPSRACLLRGQYAHNIGYRTNQAGLDAGGGFTGGTEFYRLQGYDKDDLPVWLKRAGYHTMLVGKYYQGITTRKRIFGWDDFSVWLGNRFFNARRMTVDSNGVFSGENIPGYRTTNETNDAIELIESFAKKKTNQNRQPFFMYLAPVAPHSGPTGKDVVPDRWKDRFVDVQIPESESFDEADVADKPRAYRSTPRLSELEKSFLRDQLRVRLIGMLGIDEMLARILKSLDELKLADNTIIILTSDHGYMLGEHRQFGKSFPMDVSTRIPLWVYQPGKTKPLDSTSSEANHLLAHIDITATVADLAGATVPEFVDGRSFAKLISNPETENEAIIRDSVLIENWESRLNALSDEPVIYSSMRMPQTIYTEWSNGEREFYDLEIDPNQLDNGYSKTSADEKAKLASTLRSLKENSSHPTTNGQVTFRIPFASRSVIGPSLALEGLVDTSSGVTDIEVFVQQSSTGKYWTGESWSENRFALEPTIANPNGLISQWRLLPNLNEVAAGEKLRITATSSEQKGNDCLPQSRDVVFDTVAPEVQITRPIAGREYESFFSFGGKMADNLGVGHVTLIIKNVEDGQFFDGDRWHLEEVEVPVLINPKTGVWHANYAMPKGSFEVTARGFDAAGNTAKLKRRTFSLK